MAWFSITPSKKAPKPVRAVFVDGKVEISQSLSCTYMKFNLTTADKNKPSAASQCMDSKLVARRS